MFDYFLKKRLKCESSVELTQEGILVDDEYNNTYEINIESLIIPKEVKNDFEKSNSQFIFAKTYLLNEISDINVLKFAVFILRNCSSQQGFKELIEPEHSLFDLIIVILFTSEEIEIKYELSWILINITYSSNKFHSKLLKKEVLEKIFSMTYEKRLLVHALWLFNNIISNDKIILKTVISALPDYKNRLRELVYNVNSPEVKCLLMESIMTLIENLSKPSKLVKYSYLIDSIFIKYLNLTDELTYKSLLVLTCLTKSEEINIMIIDKEYFEILLRYFEDMTGENRKFVLIIRCLGNIAISNNSLFAGDLIKNGKLLTIIENILADYIKNPNKLKNHIILLRETLSTLANLLMNNELVASSLVNKTNIYRLLINIMPMTKNVKVINEILYCFINLYKSCNYKIKIDILKGNLIDMLIRLLEIENEEIVSMILESLIIFTEYAQDLYQIKTEFKLKLIQNSLTDKLNLCLKNKNSITNQKAEFLLNILENEDYTYQ